LLLWLPVPFVILAVILAGQSDPTLPQERASYNFSFGFVLVSFLIAIPWLVSNLVGMLIGRRLRKAPPAMAAAPYAAPPPADPDLPDWRRPDASLLGEPEIGARMREIAARAGIPERTLPWLAPPFDREGEFVFRDRFDYVYTAVERGAPLFEHRAAVADELLYMVFRDRAWMVAAGYVADVGAPPEQDPDRIADRQQAILAGIDPRWGRQFALERARKAGG
jgi:hypothetical protein